MTIIYYDFRHLYTYNNQIKQVKFESKLKFSCASLKSLRIASKWQSTKTRSVTFIESSYKYVFLVCHPEREGIIRTTSPSSDVYNLEERHYFSNLEILPLTLLRAQNNHSTYPRFSN